MYICIYIYIYIYIYMHMYWINYHYNIMKKHVIVPHLVNDNAIISKQIRSLRVGMV